MPFFHRKQDTDGAAMSVSELKRRLDRHEATLVVDVRQPDGFRTHPFTIPGSMRIPPSDLPDRYAELPRDRTIVLFCT